ncbi:MAG: hypothetical protein GX278_07355 [Aeromonadales bacterium]|nr:hypothetical protein [Aeromonadales bacterium]
MNKNKIAIITLASCVLGTSLMNGCTNPVSEAGTVQSYYEGTITGMEAIDIDTNKHDGTSNSLLGAIGGAIIGNLISKNSTGTLVGAGLGAVAAGGASSLSDRHDGVRLTINSDNGPLIVDMPFSCKYAVGKKVRLISGSSQGSVMVENNGKYATATEDSYDKCPALYNSIKSN